MNVPATNKSKITADDLRAYQYMKDTSDRLDDASHLLNLFRQWVEDSVLPGGIYGTRDYLAVLTTAITAVNKANRELGKCVGEMYMELDVL